MSTPRRTGPSPGDGAAAARVRAGRSAAGLARWLRRNLVPIFALLAFVYLFVPIAYTIAFSFNNAGRTNLVWQGFTTKNWKNPCGAPRGLQRAGQQPQDRPARDAASRPRSARWSRSRWPGTGSGAASATNLLIFLPMATPEVVLGAALLTLFLNVGVEPGFWTIVIAHVMFCISFVVVTVKARLASLDPRLEQAAMDLYADEWQAFRRVTLPLAAPGHRRRRAAGVQPLVRRLHHHELQLGNVNTFPKFVYVSATRGIPAQANVIGTVMFVVALLVVLIGQLLSRRRAV